MFTHYLRIILAIIALASMAFGTLVLGLQLLHWDSWMWYVNLWIAVALALLAVGGIGVMLSSYFAIENRDGQLRFRKNWLGTQLSKHYQKDGGNVRFCRFYTGVAFYFLMLIGGCFAIVIFGVLGYGLVTEGFGSMVANAEFSTFDNFKQKLSVIAALGGIALALPLAYNYLGNVFLGTWVEKLYTKTVCPFIRTD